MSMVPAEGLEPQSLITINYWYVDQLALVQCDYLARSAHAGKVVRVSQEWRQVVRQGTGKTGMPEAKAGRVANALARSSRPPQ